MSSNGGAEEQRDGVSFRFPKLHPLPKKQASKCMLPMKKISVHVPGGRVQRGRYKATDFQIEKVEGTQTKTCPLFRVYNPDNFLIACFDRKCPPDAVEQFLLDGLTVRYSDHPRVDVFVFFGHSASQLRERTCVLYNQQEKNVEEVLKGFGEFGKIRDVAKRAARIGLLFSTADPICTPDDEQIDDIERDRYIFTDGCGFVSSHVALEITERLEINSLYENIKSPAVPSVYQVRFKGCKGVLMHNPALRGGIQTRPSMEKFKWLLGEPSDLGVVDRGYSRPYEFGSLNKQYIMLLSALGIADEVFLRKQDLYFKALGEITENLDVAFMFLCANEEYAMAESLLKTGTLDKKATKKLKHLRNRVGEKQRSSQDNPFKKPKKSAAERLKIPIEESRNVYGVCDPTGRLEPGTVFFQPTVRGKPVVLHTSDSGGRVVVAKNPCYHPGDIRVLRCVDEPDCRHLVDCVVFPTTGNRPHSDEIAGSDLDGDKYFVCWDDQLVPKSEVPPCQYPAAKPRKKDNIAREDCVCYFSRYSNATVGTLDRLFECWADTKGVNSPECREIAALFSRAVDAAKTGEKVKISKHLVAAPLGRKGNFVWLKLLERAKVFESDRYLEAEITANVTDITEEDMLHILRNKESRCSEYRLFRFLYKWCEHVGKVDSITQYISHIDFSKFTTEQIERYRVTVDVPEIDLEMLLNPLHQSKILSDEDIDFFSRSPAFSRKRWRMLYQADGEEMSWTILDNVFRSPIQKLVTFQFLLGGVKWVISIVMAMSLESHEVITIDDEHPLEAATAHVSVHSGSGAVPHLNMKGYSFSWQGDRLDIYTGRKQSTFICLKKGEVAEEGPIMSVALDRFKGNLPGEPQTRIRKEKVLAVEVFCLYDSCDAGHTVRQIRSAAIDDEEAVAPQQRKEQFQATDADFPRMNATPEELLSDLERVYKELHDSLQTGQLQKCQLQELADRMVAAQHTSEEESHEIACHLEFFLGKANATAAFTSSERYKQLILFLITGLRHFRLDTVFGEETQTTLTGRIRRALDTMWRHEVQFSFEEISEILYALLLGNDYSTACKVLRFVREGYFPLESWTFHPNALPYSLHFVSLITLEALEEVKQATQTQAQKPPITAQATPRDEEEETFTLLVTSGPHPFRRGEGVALSRSHVFKREYVAEVRDVTGNMLSVSFIWPSSISYVSLKDIITAPTSQWHIFPFPSLVGYKRVLAAFKDLRQMHSNAEALFDQIVGSFACVNDVNNDECTEIELRYDDHVVQCAKGDDLETGATAVETSGTTGVCFLNESQEEAVNYVLRGLPVAIIQGPPGTGKTVTCAEIVRRWLLGSGDPVLVVAETNEGVDNLMKKLAAHVSAKPGEIVRVGSSSWSVTKELQRFSLEQLYKERVTAKKGQFDKMDKKVVKKIIRAARVVCSTCISSGSTHLEGHVFRRVLVDEASQAKEPVILVATSHGCQQLVLVGDDQQLPPMVQCELASGLSTPLFTRMRSVGVKVHMLEIQYRMHPTIALFPSTTFYDGKLRNGVTTEDRKPPSGFAWPCSQKPVAFISMPDHCVERSKGSSKLNDYEAETVSHLIRDLLSGNDVNCSQIGVVTPYRAQVERISGLISGDIAVRTVDGFQGQERDVIVFSAVRCNEHGYVGFLDDAKRMNVLLTRARRGLVVVGNRHTLSHCDMWKEWIRWADEEQLVRQQHQGPTEQAATTGGSRSGHNPGSKRDRRGNVPRQGRGRANLPNEGRNQQTSDRRGGRDRRGNASRGSPDMSRQGRGRADLPDEGRNQQTSARRGGGRGQRRNGGSRGRSSQQ